MKKMLLEITTCLSFCVGCEFNHLSNGWGIFGMLFAFMVGYGIMDYYGSHYDEF